jgi:hypothetical protein
MSSASVVESEENEITLADVAKCLAAMEELLHPLQSVTDKLSLLEITIAEQSTTTTSFESRTHAH